MSEVYPWIGFKSKKDRERFKSRIFSEQKKMKPGVVSAESGKCRFMADREIRQCLNIHNAKYGEGETFYVLSDLIKIPDDLYWVIFQGTWDLLEVLENVLKKEYKNYVYLVTH